MNLTIRQLQAFREVMRTGSISEAAKTLGRTQPAVSSMIAGLEEELGVELFKRQRGRLIKKPEASYFAIEAEAILDRLSQTTRTMKEIGKLQEGRLRIACMPASAQFMIPNLVAQFIKDKPRINVSLMMRTSAAIEEWVASQQFDIGLAETPTPNNAFVMKNFNLRCLCAFSHQDPLCEKDVITAQDLSDLPLAALNEGHPNRLATEEAFRKAGAVYNQRFELRNFQSAFPLIEEQLCYCICDPMSASSYLRSYLHGAAPKLVFKPFEPYVGLGVSILQPAHRPASLLSEMFVEKLTEELMGFIHQYGGYAET